MKQPRITKSKQDKLITPVLPYGNIVAIKDMLAFHSNGTIYLMSNVYRRRRKTFVRAYYKSELDNVSNGTHRVIITSVLRDECMPTTNV